MYNTLGIITPDITRSLGFISDEANRTIGYITPDITRSLGAEGDERQLISTGRTVLGVPLATWGIILGATGAGTAAVGFIATRSVKGSVYGAIGGVLSAGAGIAVAGIVARKTLAGFVSRGSV